jgi:hypothetical protein
MKKNLRQREKSLFALFLIISLLLTIPAAVLISRATGGGTAYCSDLAPPYINASSTHVELFQINAQTNYVAGAGAYLDRIYVNFSGTGFTTSDFNPLIDGDTAGLSIWIDADNPSGDGVFNSVTDTMLIPSSIKWSGSQVRVTLPRSIDTQFTLVNTNFTFYVIIRTSSTITDNDIIDATIDSIWINASNATRLGITLATITADTFSPSVAQNTISTPNGGEQWSGTQSIQWDETRITDSHLLATPISISYSSTGGAPWTLIATNEPNDGSYSWDTTTAGGDGASYKINITAVDGAGKIGFDLSNATFELDNTRPSCIVAYNRSSSYLKSGVRLRIYANFTEGGSGIDESTVKISINTAGNGDLTNTSMTRVSNTRWYYDWTIPSGSDDDGVLTVRIWAKDNASNNVNPFPTTEGSKTIDNTAPSVSSAAITSPDGGEQWSGSHMLTWNPGDISDSHLMASPITLSYSSNAGGSWTQIATGLANSGSYSWSTTSVPDGSAYLIRMLATDMAGNVGSDVSNSTFTIDNSDPTCSIAYNRSEMYLKAGLKLKIFANFTEGSAGIDDASVRVSIGTVGDGDLANSSMSKTDDAHWYYGWTVPAGSDEDGVFTVRIWARDNASNYLNPYPTTDASKRIDNTAPDCSIAYNRSATYLKAGDRIRVYANFSETPSGMNPATVMISISTLGNGDLANTSMSQTNNLHWYYTWTVPSGSDEDGVFTVRIWARDNASNLLSSYPTTDSSKTLDNTAPSVSTAVLLSPNGGEAWSGTHMILWSNAAITDAHLAANPITISYSNNGGSSWNQIASLLANDGSHSWSTTSVTDGSAYLIRVLAVDLAGNVGSDVSNTTFTVDNTEPTCSIAYNRSASYLIAGMKLKIFANFTEGFAGIDDASVRISIGTAGNGDLTNTSMSKTDDTHWYYGWTVPTGSDDDGTIVVNIWASDTANNPLNPTPTISTTKHIDNTAPVCSIAYNRSKTYFNYADRLTIYANFTETGSGISESSVRISITTIGNGDLANTSMTKVDNTHWYYAWVIPYGSDDDGVITVRLWAQDNISTYVNPYPTTSAVKRIDNTRPTCVIGYNRTALTFIEGTKLRIYANFTETGSGISPSTVLIGITTPGDGTQSPIAMAQTNNTRWYYNWVIPSGSDDDGTFSVSIWASDNESNLLNPAPTIDSSRVIDNTAPTCALSFNRSATYFRNGDALKIYANFTESGTGINETTLRISLQTAGNGDLMNTSMTKIDNTHWYYGWTVPSGSDDDGAATVRIWAWDNIGNPLEPYPTTSSTKQIDNTAPLVPAATIIYPNGGEQLSGMQTITWNNNAITESHPVANPITLYYSSNGGGSWTQIASGEANDGTYSWNVGLVAEGSNYKVKVLAVDLAGNTANDTSDGTFTIDNTNPACSIAYNRSGPYFKAGSRLRIYANFTEADSDINESSVKLSITTVGNGGLANVSMSKTDSTHWYYGWIIPAGSDDDGSCTVKIWAKDNVGKTLIPWPTTDSSKQIDNTVPSVSLATMLSPNGGEQWFGTHTITWLNTSITDAHLLTNPITLYYSTNGGGSWVQIASVEANDGAYSWNTEALADGTNYNVKVVAIDQAGNSANDTADTTFTLDNTPPTCVLAYNRSSTYLSQGTKIKIFANFTETTSGINESLIRLSISTIGNGDLSNTTLYRSSNTRWYYNWTVPSGSDDDGTCLVSVYAQDNAGNTLTSYPTTSSAKRIDNTLPTSTVSSIVPHYHDTSTYMTISATASDVPSGLQSVSLFFSNSTDNFTWSGPFSYAVDTNPWQTVSWNFSFLATNSTGFYRFYSIAKDNATNIETAPVAPDAWCLYNRTNSPPNASKNPTPASGATNVDLNTTLSWVSGGDPDGNSVKFEVYFGTDSTPDDTEFKVRNLTTPSYYPGSLVSGTTYYWLVITRDNHSIGTVGPTWSFTTSSTTQDVGDQQGGSQATIPPTAEAGGPYTGYVTEEIFFNASKSSKTNGSLIGYRWDFTNDGSFDTAWLTKATTTHAYTQAGSYTVKVQVKDNSGLLDNDTAKVTIKVYPIVNVSTDAMTKVETTFGLHFDEPFYANDTDDDGTIDTFSDPNNLLTAVRFVRINGNSSFLISTADDEIPEFIWDTKANTTMLVDYVPILSTETWIDTETQEILITAMVEKTGWIYIEIPDAYPPDMYPRYTLTVNTSNGRVISPDMIWREDGIIYILDDPSAQYVLAYGYTILPPVFSPLNGTVLHNARPPVTVTFFEETTITAAFLGDTDIRDQIFTTDNITYVFTPSSDLADGSYTLSLTAMDDEGNSISSTSTYIISAPRVSSAGIPWFVILIIACVLLVVGILILLRIRLVI